MADLLFAATAAVYLAACVLFVLFLLGRAERATAWAPRLVALGVPLHAAQIVVSSLVLHVCPVQGIPATGRLSFTASVTPASEPGADRASRSTWM